MLQIILGQDGTEITGEATKIKIANGDKRYVKRNLKNYVFDFVGFVIEKEKILAVFPKHFFDDCKNTEVSNQKEIEENIRLLFRVINKYNTYESLNALDNKYVEDEENFESDYPFEAFYKVYDYYKKYGIYKEEEEIYSQNGISKVSWKKTIQKSNIINCNGNMIFLPIYSKMKTKKDVFISECMTFIINYTIKNFYYFIQLPPIQDKEYKIDFLANKEYTLRQLYQCRNIMFKDHQKKLINALITFFEKYDKKAIGDPIRFKVNYFERIWESMVNKYLNDYFVGVDKESHKLIFDTTKKNKTKKFKSEKFRIDKSEHSFSILPDHYYSDGNTIYVFDTKYYDEIKTLNYKQFAYTILFGNSELGRNKELYSALLFPGEGKSGLHLELDSKFCQTNLGCNYIIEHYLNVKLLMKNYLDL